MDNLSRSLWMSLAVGVALVFLAACGGSSTGGRTATPPLQIDVTSPAASVDPAVTPRPPTVKVAPTSAGSSATQSTPGPCPNENACTVGRALASALSRGDADFVLGHWPAAQFTCPGPAAKGEGQPLPLCDGAPAGEVRTGYLVSGSTTAFADSREGIAAWIRTPPRAGGAWALRTVGCPPGSGAPACSDRALIVMTAGTPVKGPDVLFDVAQSGGQWRITGLMRGATFQPALDLVLVNGGFVAAESHSSVPAGTRFYRVN